MAKLTVFFKYKAIDSYLFEQGIVHIGRDDTNELVIDSLAVAPVHAAVIMRGETCMVKQLNDSFPLIINGQKVKECELKSNDSITLGKHNIIYQPSESTGDMPRPIVANEPEDFQIQHITQEPASFLLGNHTDDDIVLPPAALQVMSGASIGKVLPIKKAMTRLGSTGHGIVIISRRRDGYYASALENKGQLTVNGTPLGNHYLKLNPNDVLAINQTSLLFFLS
jgi:hypothetical protein